MPRKTTKKCIKYTPEVTFFKPQGIPMRDLKRVCLSHDELEVIRLVDYLEFGQVEAAEKMKTSQSTVQRLVTSARKKVAEAVVEGFAIEIHL
ncbi:DUF134 domain-containing protein [Patescibacteria group bacterium]|nr:DUF134 domain-containing protein [Patescibacteria group bacterium]